MSVATRIRINRLGIDLGIIQGDGIDVPLTRAAHHPLTGWPNGGSNIFLYAHARPGLFMGLWNARIGDIVELDLANGATKRYRVDTVMPKVRWDATYLLEPTATEQLTLQTCVSYGTTEPRFVVIAHPVG